MKRLLSPWLLVTALGIACGCSRSVMAPPPAPGIHSQFSDLDWVRGQYFLLYDPSSGAPLAVDETSIRLYRDDANAANDHDTAPCKAVLDPDGALGQPLTPAQAGTSVTGNFDLLTPGVDLDYELLHDLFAFHDTTYIVIRLKQPIATQANEALAVSFRARRWVGPAQLGPPIDVGGRRLDTPGPDSGSILVKLLRVPRSLERPAPDGITYDPTSPLAPARELELKNIYWLGGFNIDPASFTLTLQEGQTDPPVTSQSGVSFIEMLGLDSWHEVSGNYFYGPDGRIDAIGYNMQTRRVDYANGLLFLPDFRPFAPRLDGPSAMVFDRFLDAHVNRRLRLGRPGAPAPSSPDPYSLYNPRALNGVWYFTASWAGPAPRAGN
jgi:hypothetical protein